ncbi:RRQRL motif-containing zinc-binding protein [Streptomyces sp. NPDC048659]|uniref:RRQRL motif-containing zinc-binding protein n=1 Tax=Streptomyces sp. NPDC048659 TaxID=3155489 RepID=UPI00341D963F
MKLYDPTGTLHGVPTYPRRLAPEGLATRRQLRAQGLRPGGQPVAAEVRWYGRRTGGIRPVRRAFLYSIAQAAPVRPMTPARWRAHAAMMRARRTCPLCRRECGYVIPTSLGSCVPCADAPAS